MTERAFSLPKRKRGGEKFRNTAIDKKRPANYNGFMKKSVRIFLTVICYVAAAIAVATIVAFSIFKVNSARMPEDFESAKSVKFIAHRGLSSVYYENSEQAFIAAAASDFFYGIETDVYFTADGVAVCAHDDDAFENGSVKITESNYEEIKNLSLKENDYGYTSEAICTFERYLEITAAGDKVAVIELKQPDLTKEQIQELISLSERICGDDFVMISFEAKHVKNVEKINADLVTQRLSNNVFTNWFAAMNGYNVSVAASSASKYIVNLAHRRGREIGVWTVNSVEDMKKFVEMGVDYITTDFDFSA